MANEPISGSFMIVKMFRAIEQLITTKLWQLIKDSEIKADIAIKAKQEIAFAGVNCTLANRIITLSGNSLPIKQKVKWKKKKHQKLRTILYNCNQKNWKPNCRFNNH